jgi:hypothetical protein
VAILGFVLEVPVPVLMYRVATGWVHLFGVKCKKCFMHENTTNNTLCTVVYIVYCICVRKVTSCLSAGMAAHKFNIKYYSIQYCFTNLGRDPCTTHTCDKYSSRDNGITPTEFRDHEVGTNELPTYACTYSTPYLLRYLYVTV